MNASEAGVARTLAEAAKERGVQPFTGGIWNDNDEIAYAFEHQCGPEWVIDTLDTLEEAAALLERVRTDPHVSSALWNDTRAFLAAWRTPEVTE